MVAQMKKRIKKEQLEPWDYLDTKQVAMLMAYVGLQAKKARPGTHRAAVNEMIVTLLLATGLRAAELCDLKMIHLPHKHGKNLVHVACGKNGKPRTVPIQPVISDKIKVFVKEHRKGAKPGSYLFENERGGQLSYRSLYSKIVGIGDRSGVSCGKKGHLHPHMIRHSFLSLAYSVTNDRELVQRMAGHKHSDTTSIYIHMGTEAVREKIERVNIAGFMT